MLKKVNETKGQRVRSSNDEIGSRETKEGDKRRKIKSLGEGTSDACHVIESRKMDSENSSCSFDKVEKVLLYCLAGKHIKSFWHSFEMNMFFSSNTPRVSRIS